MTRYNRHHITDILGVIIMVMLVGELWSCSSSQGPGMKNPQRSVYYWRTTFSLSDKEKVFIQDHNIKRMYLHVFDVIRKNGKPVPDATLLFNEQTDSFAIPSINDIVPVVFITNDVITNDSSGTTTLAHLIINRVTQMMDANKIPWHELQIDFDWTQRNQAVYFGMLSKMRELLNKQKCGISATIRLHQLVMTPPPVDYGALMVYNIGNYSKADEPNSIISVDNLKPYLQYLADYQLPLATALPLYSWDLVFQKEKFLGIARGLNLSDTTKYYHVSDTLGRGDRYVVKSYHVATNDDVTLMQPGLTLTPGSIIRHEECSYDVLKQVREMLWGERSNALDEVILYHLDNNNINRYSNEQIENLFSSH